MVGLGAILGCLERKWVAKLDIPPENPSGFFGQADSSGLAFGPTLAAGGSEELGFFTGYVGVNDEQHILSAHVDDDDALEVVPGRRVSYV